MVIVGQPGECIRCLHDGATIVVDGAVSVCMPGSALLNPQPDLV
jgi:hypothetical protein